METLQAAISNAIAGRHKAKGMSCLYYRLNHWIGLKRYSHINEGIFSYLVQKELSDNGLAPRCLGWCFTYDYLTTGQTEFCYLTEHISCFEKNMRSMKDEHKLKVQTFINDFDLADSSGFTFRDLHEGNVGYRIKNGDITVMVLDTGCFYASGGYSYREVHKWRPSEFYQMMDVSENFEFSIDNPVSPLYNVEIPRQFLRGLCETPMP